MTVRAGECGPSLRSWKAAKRASWPSSMDKPDVGMVGGKSGWQDWMVRPP